MHRRTLLLGLVLTACVARGAPVSAPDGEARTVYVVRHAEKELDAGNDPLLTGVGVARAAALPGALTPGDLVAIYSTDTRRTRATVQPTAEATGLQIQIYEAGADAALLASIRAQPPGAVLVAGHSNTVPHMLAAFGVEESVTIADDQYGDLFVVRLESGGASLQIRHFGDE